VQRHEQPHECFAVQWSVQVEVKIEVECRVRLPKHLPMYFETQLMTLWSMLSDEQWEVQRRIMSKSEVEAKVKVEAEGVEEAEVAARASSRGSPEQPASSVKPADGLRHNASRGQSGHAQRRPCRVKPQRFCHTETTAKAS